MHLHQETGSVQAHHVVHLQSHTCPAPTTRSWQEVAKAHQNNQAPVVLVVSHINGLDLAAEVLVHIEMLTAIVGPHGHAHPNVNACM